MANSDYEDYKHLIRAINRIIIKIDEMLIMFRFFFSFFRQFYIDI